MPAAALIITSAMARLFLHDFRQEAKQRAAQGYEIRRLEVRVNSRLAFL